MWHMPPLLLQSLLSHFWINDNRTAVPQTIHKNLLLLAFAIDPDRGCIIATVTMGSFLEDRIDGTWFGWRRVVTEVQVKLFPWILAAIGTTWIEGRKWSCTEQISWTSFFIWGLVWYVWASHSVLELSLPHLYRQGGDSTKMPSGEAVRTPLARELRQGDFKWMSAQSRCRWLVEQLASGKFQFWV